MQFDESHSGVKDRSMKESVPHLIYRISTGPSRRQVASGSKSVNDRNIYRQTRCSLYKRVMNVSSQQSAADIKPQKEEQTD